MEYQSLKVYCKAGASPTGQSQDKDNNSDALQAKLQSQRDRCKLGFQGRAGRQLTAENGSAKPGQASKWQRLPENRLTILYQTYLSVSQRLCRQLSMHATTLDIAEDLTRGSAPGRHTL